MNRLLRKSLLIPFLIMPAACVVGPDYVRPVVEKSPSFKETPEWKQAEPKDDIPHGKWWEMFDQADSASDSACYLDTKLNELEEQIVISNQNVKESEANFRQAQAAVLQARSAFFPQIGANYSDARTNNPPTTTVFGYTSPGVVFNQYDTGLSANWELDVWGRIRRDTESKQAEFQASAADLEAAKLSEQADLAQDYINLRFADEQQRLLNRTTRNNEETLRLTRALYTTGISRKSDVAQAEAKLESSRAEALDVGIQRAGYEHAIAILIGKAPASFSLPPTSYVPATPNVPVILPSELVERRPDVAGAERRVASANAQIGVAQAAFFPKLSFNVSGGYQSFAFEHFSQLFSNVQRVWSIGPSVDAPLFDAGLRIAQKREAIAAYDEKVAAYRLTVLNSFKEVEDALVRVHLLEQEAVAQHAAAASSREAVDLLLAQYKEGITRYLDVMTAQNDETTNEVNALQIENKRATVAVSLIKALGGGWNAKALDE